jgi:hypothetical protein
MHADEIAFWKSGSGSPEQREKFLESFKAQWRAAQKPTESPQPTEKSPSKDRSVDTSYGSAPSTPDAPNNIRPLRSHSWRVRARALRIKSRSAWRVGVRAPLTRLKDWLKKYAWLGFFGGAVAMVQINEYAIAVLLLAFSALALYVQIFDWKGFPERRELTGGLKAFGFLFVAGLLIFWVALFIRIKGSKPWSNIFLEEGPPVSQLQQTPSPTITPAPQSRDIIVQEQPLPEPSLVVATPSPSPTLRPSPPLQLMPSPQPSPTAPPAAPFTSDTKIGLLQCSVSEYNEGYKILRGATCIAKHQQTGVEFIGTVGEQGHADINLPYGFYVVMIKAEGYITRVEAIKVGEEVASVVVELQKAR